MSPLPSHPTGAENGPFNVTIEATPLSVFIEWMELSDNIPLVTGYNITVENLITKKVRTVHVEGSSGEANVSGLTPLTEYSFTVAAVYQYGLGPPSRAVIQRTREQGKCVTHTSCMCMHDMCVCGVHIVSS